MKDKTPPKPDRASPEAIAARIVAYFFWGGEVIPLQEAIASAIRAERTP